MRTVIAGLLSLISVFGCAVAPNLQDTCTFLPNIKLSTFGYSSLVVEAGLPAKFSPVDAIMVLYSPSFEKPIRDITLRLDPAESSVAHGPDRSSCEDIRWHYFTVSYDEGEWHDFWSQTFSERFNVGFAFSDGPASAPAKSFGLAVLDTSSDRILISCGCYVL